MKKAGLFILILLNCSFMFCQQNDYAFIKEAINQYWSTLPYGKNWTSSRSSVLQEKGKSPDFYEYDKAFDKNLETAWVEGAPGNGTSEYIMTNVFEKYKKWYENFNYQEAKESNGINIFLSLNNGYCKNESLYLKNNRVKKARIVFYDTPVAVGQNSTTIDAEPVVVYNEEIELKDTMDEQNFSFKINTRDDNIYSSPFVIMQLIILDVYPGTDYDNTCISEINVYGEYAEE